MIIKDHISGENIYFITRVVLELRDKLWRFYNFDPDRYQKANEIILKSFFQTVQAPNWRLVHIVGSEFSMGPSVNIEETLANLTRAGLINSDTRPRLERIFIETFQHVLEELE